MKKSPSLWWFALLPILFLLAMCCAANAQELIPFQLVIKVNPALALAFNPSAPSIACNVPGGTLVAAITASGGDGNPITLSITGDTTDFALSATTLPANVIVASGGITSASGKCPLTAPVTETVTINASQP